MLNPKYIVNPETHKTNKGRHDDKESGSRFSIRHLLWLYVPAIKQGRPKKFSSLWQGPYTVIDKTLQEQDTTK